MIDKPILWAFWGHEPLMFYKRRDGNRRTLFANGEWIDAWYNRLHTEEAIARLADMGVNLIYTHFYKAMGFEFEREEMENTVKIVEIAHKYGIKVLGYATINNVYDESLLCEIPDFDSMRGVRVNGETTDCYREKVCLNSRYYTDYFPKVLKYGIEHVGLDGFHFDNATGSPCYCEKCTAGFRKFLEDNIPDPRSVGVPSFKHVRIPRIPLFRGKDAISLMAVRYFRSLYESVYGGIFQYAKSLRPDDPPIVLINSGFGNSEVASDRLGYEIASDMAYDFVFVENPDRFIGKRSNGECINSVICYKLANMSGKKAFNTMWTEFGVEPKNPAVIKRVLMEGIVFGAVAGTNWAGRSVKSGSKMLLDDDMHFSTIRHCFNYFKEYSGIYENSRTLCDVRVLYLADSRLAKGNPYDKTFYPAVDALADNGIVYSTVRLSDIKEPFKGVMLIPDAEFLADEEVARLAELKAAGAELVFLGDPGVYRANGEERENWPFRDDRIIPIPAADAEAVAAFKKQVVDAMPRSVRLNKEHLLVERAVTADGKEVIHILNQDNDVPVLDLEVTVGDLAGDLQELISPDETTPEFSVENGVIRISSLDTLVTLIFKK